MGGRFRRNQVTAHVVIGVHAAASGRGVGTGLLKELELWAAAHAVHRLELTVMAHNQRARELYEPTRRQNGSLGCRAAWPWLTVCLLRARGAVGRVGGLSAYGLAAWQHDLMRCLRTPEDRFADLPGFAYPPRYADAGGVRLAWVEAGPPDGEPCPARRALTTR